MIKILYEYLYHEILEIWICFQNTGFANNIFSGFHSDLCI